MSGHDTKAEKSKGTGCEVGNANLQDVGEIRLLLSTWAKARLYRSSAGRFQSEGSKLKSVDGNSESRTPPNAFVEAAWEEVIWEVLDPGSTDNAEKTSLSSGKSSIGVTGE